MSPIIRSIRRHGLALLALLVALGGTTYAATSFPANVIGAPQLKKGAVTTPKLKNNAVTGAKVANNSFTGADLVESSLGEVRAAARADRALTATSASRVSNANHATSADTATSATNATNATNATHATSATHSTRATNVAEASRATETNQLGGSSPQLGGSSAVGFQPKLPLPCTDGFVLTRPVAPPNVVNDPFCTLPAIRMISLDKPVNSQGSFGRVLGVDFELLCTPAAPAIRIENGGGTGTLNWFYGDGSTLLASGIALAEGGAMSFTFDNARIEGQFIFARGTDVLTLKLHAFDGGSFCEVRGTVASASSA